MLVHYFWLLGFKLKFEFHCLNPFLKIPKPFSLPTLFLLHFQPSTLSSPAAAVFFPFIPARSRLAAQLASRLAQLAGPAAASAASRSPSARCR
jgi:hypothetical protein